MEIKVTFTDGIYTLGVYKRISRVITIKKVGRNRLKRTVETEAKKMFPMMQMNNYEVLQDV